MSDKKLSIRLHVYDTDIPVNINREDEELYRNAAKLITDAVNEYARRYSGKKGVKEVLYMALIDIALRYVREAKRNDTAPINDMLVKITSEIEDVLKE